MLDILIKADLEACSFLLNSKTKIKPSITEEKYKNNLVSFIDKD